jgi:phosphatidylserine decarboxylase
MIAPEALPFILGALALTAALYFLLPKTVPLWVVGALFLAFTVWFFRNPERTPPPDPGGQVISPADGRVIYCGDCPAGRYQAEAGRKISIFMSPLNVHVNRAPVSGKVTSVLYNKGRYFAANVDKASLENEQNGVTIETAGGKRVTYVQIAGFIARRIVCDVKPGDAVVQGRRVGLIRFGSRVDVYLPAGAELRVKVGDRTRAGESVLGTLR